MKILGLILEINPFHNGHKYFINQAITKINPDLVVSVVSTSFTMRGDVSLLSKFDKTQLLLNNDVDIVMELPTSKTLNSADYFGYHTIDILNKMGVTDIVFGLENGRIDILDKLYQLTNNYNTSDSVSNKKSLKINHLDFLKSITDDNELLEYSQKPNFILALSYLKAINKINPDIKYHVINRIDNFYDDCSFNFKSAYTLRTMLKNNESIDKYLPYEEILLQNANEDLLLKLIQYRFSIDNIPLIKTKEGLENYIKNNLKALNYQELINNLANKKYTKSRIKRFLISSLLNIPIDYNQFEEYYRILGFNQKGLNFINSLDKNTKSSLKTTLKNEQTKTGLLELQSTKLYSLLTNNELLINEYQIPIKKL